MSRSIRLSVLLVSRSDSCSGFTSHITYRSQLWLRHCSAPLSSDQNQRCAQPNRIGASRRRATTRTGSDASGMYFATIPTGIAQINTSIPAPQHFAISFRLFISSSYKASWDRSRWTQATRIRTILKCLASQLPDQARRKITSGQVSLKFNVVLN